MVFQNLRSVFSFKKLPITEHLIPQFLLRKDIHRIDIHAPSRRHIRHCKKRATQQSLGVIVREPGHHKAAPVVRYAVHCVEFDVLEQLVELSCHLLAAIVGRGGWLVGLAVAELQ